MRLLALLLILFPHLAAAGEALVAVASNFADTARRLAQEYQAASGHRIRISSASSGKLFAQIRHGAPFDLFLSADAQRPRRLQQEGLTLSGSLRTYALGRLVFWDPDHRGDAEACRQRLRQAKRIAMANPRTAPYGAAARQVLQALGLRTVTPVLGENIAQAYAFTAAGSVDGGFVAASQLSAQAPPRGCRWPVPERLHQPLRQQMVLLQRARDNPAARGFHRFLQSPRAGELIRQAGYRLP
jgi:molybdate transport system substrate-binding protein